MRVAGRADQASHIAGCQESVAVDGDEDKPIDVVECLADVF